MSAHSFNTRTGKSLQEKSDESLDNKIVEAILNCDISGLSKKDARAKLDGVIEGVKKLHGK